MPNGSYATIAGKIEGFITSDDASDLSIQGQALCPLCADGVSQTMCEWKLQQYTPGTAPDRLFLRSPGVFLGVFGGNPTPSLNLSLGGQQYSLVGVSYHLALGLALERNHFVSQFRSRGS